MASAKKLPSGAWRTRATKIIDGKQVRKSFTVHPDECAGDWRQAKAKSESMAQNWIFDRQEEQQHISVEKAIQMHIETHSAVWSPSTLHDYIKFPKYFDAIKHFDSMEIDSKIIQQLINQWTFDGLSKKTIANRINFLRNALELVGNDKNFKIKYPKYVQPELLPPEHSEFKRLLDAANAEDKLIIILAGLYTLRRGEIAGLCGEDILWDMNSIYVHTDRVINEHNKWVRKEMPKTAQSVRRIELAPEVMAMIPHVGPKEYLIKVTPYTISKRFRKLRAKVCVDCRFHDLRKYAASIRSEIMPNKYVEADGGWRPDSKVLKTIYDKPFKETRKEYSKKINTKIVEDYGEQLLG
jgi:integrase